MSLSRIVSMIWCSEYNRTGPGSRRGRNINILHRHPSLKKGPARRTPITFLSRIGAYVLCCWWEPEKSLFLLKTLNSTSSWPWDVISFRTDLLIRDSSRVGWSLLQAKLPHFHHWCVLLSLLWIELFFLGPCGPSIKVRQEVSIAAFK